MIFVMKKQMLFVLLALGISAAFLAYDTGISAQTERPAVAPQEIARDGVTAPARGAGRRTGAPAMAPALPMSPGETSAASTAKPAPTATPTPAEMPEIVGYDAPSASTVTPPHVQHIVDFDGDGITDFSIIRDLSKGTDPNSQAQWWTLKSSDPTGLALVQNWGLVSDQFIAGDYDGDHKTDYAIWRGPQNGTHAAFWILNSKDGTVSIISFGVAGDSPFVVGDYDGDGKDDVAIYRTTPVGDTGPAEFWFHPSTDLSNPPKEVRVQWGTPATASTAGDFPIPGDYMGDSKTDFAVGHDNGDGTISMWIKQSDGTNNPATPQNVIRWGLTSDLYVPGDYDGDGKTDLAIVRSNGTNLEWWIEWSSDHSDHVSVWGLPSDLQNAVQGDYDGDGKTDIGIWRSSDGIFYIIGSQTGTPIYQKWGIAASNSDAPTANYNEH